MIEPQTNDPWASVDAEAQQAILRKELWLEGASVSDVRAELRLAQHQAAADAKRARAPSV